MAASSASIAASKLLNLRNSALQNLIRRHLIHPSAAAAAATSSTFHVAQSANLFRLENGSIGSPNSSSDARNLNLQAYDFVFNLQRPSATRIEAARTYAPCASKDDVYEDFDDDDEDDDDSDVDDYSGSDIDDEDADEFGDVDEDPDTRTRSRRY